MAIMIGYCGRAYQGSQFNPGMRTIEGEVFQALIKAGCITQDNSSHPNKVGLQRSARTDANVHACCNLISLKLILQPASIDRDHSQDLQPSIDRDHPTQLDAIHSSHLLARRSNYAPLIHHINRFLPPQIRVWNLIRVQNSFNCRAYCDSRVYEYSLPTWLFLPPKPGSPLYERLNQIQIIDSDPQDPHKTWSQVYRMGEYEATWWSDHPELIDQDFKSIQTEKRRSYRISNPMIDRIQSILDRFKGTHNFHNFTVGKSFQEPNSVRIMKAFKISQPFLVDDPPHPSTSNLDPPSSTATATEWISITFHGQSFMLHQIRKMIGLIVLLCRTRTPTKLVDELYGPKKVRIPKSPGIGLMLRKLRFDGYNKKITKLNQQELKRRKKERPDEQKMELDHDPTLLGSYENDHGKEDGPIIWDPIDCDEFDELFEAFKTQVLFQNIVSPSAPPPPPPAPRRRSSSTQLPDSKADEPNPSQRVAAAAAVDHVLPHPTVNVNDNDNEEEKDEQEDGFIDGDREEDPFGVWINYLDVYIGSDLNFLNPNGTLSLP